MGLSVAARVGGRLAKGVTPPADGPGPQGQRILSNDQEILAICIGLAMLGPAAEAAWRAEQWCPENRLDVNLMSLYPDQVLAVKLALRLIEEWTWSLDGFSGQSREAQRALLQGWATSGIGLRRTIWGSLHALSCAGFAEHAAWALMDYPGPCLGGGGVSGRPPGQTTAFDWDERVP